MQAWFSSVGLVWHISVRSAARILADPLMMSGRACGPNVPTNIKALRLCCQGGKKGRKTLSSSSSHRDRKCFSEESKSPIIQNSNTIGLPLVH